MIKFISKQFRKPSGIFGSLISSIMEKENKFTYEKINAKINLNKDNCLLEIGYGPGYGISYLLKNNKDLTIHGIDYSKLMYKKTLNRNKKFINKKRLKLFHGNFVEHQFENSSYQHIIAINVIYFIKDLKAFLNKIYSLLKLKGTLILYMAHKDELRKIKVTNNDIFEKYDIKEIKKLLNQIGFKDVRYELFKGNVENAYYIYAEK